MRSWHQKTNHRSALYGLVSTQAACNTAARLPALLIMCHQQQDSVLGLGPGTGQMTSMVAHLKSKRWLINNEL
jgi:phospholipid N-methyltransferase